MAEISSRQIEQLQQAFTRPERLTDGAMLAGNALAVPLLAARRRQARMEAVRTERRLGPDDAETKRRHALAQALAGRERHVRQEVARLQLTKPVVGDQSGLYGRVTRRGEPVPGVTIAALDEEGQSLAYSCTGHHGDYVLAFPPDQPVQIEVRDADRRLFRDNRAVAYPPYRTTLRDIELSKARPVCPDDRPAAPGGQVQMPSLIGMKEEEAVRVLTSLGLAAGKRRTRKGPEAGIVLEHDPGPGAAVAAGASVELTVSTADDRPAAKVPDLIGKSLHQAIEEIKKAGAGLGAVNVATDGSRTPIVRAARAGDKGDTIDLDVGTTGGDAQLMTAVIAPVIAATEEGLAVGIDSSPAAAEWLRRHKLDSQETVGETLALNDPSLRKRMGLKPSDDVGPVRGLLQAAVAQVRRI